MDTNDDASTSSSSLFLPLSSVLSFSTLRGGSTLRRHANHRVYSPLWLHAGTFYALDERGSFPTDASAHVACAATRVEALPAASSAAELVAAAFASSPSSLWLPKKTPALLLEVPWPAHVDSTAVWMEIVAGAAAAVREAIEVEKAMMEHRQQRRRRFFDLLFRPFFFRSSSAPPPPLFFSDDHDTLTLVILLPNLDAKTWRSSPGARWAREEALPLALEAAAEVALAAAADADDEKSGRREQKERRQAFFTLTYLIKDDLERRSLSKEASSAWIGFDSVIVPHGRSSTPRRDAGFGRGERRSDSLGPDALAVAFRRRVWEAAGIPLGALLAPYTQVERGCDPRSWGEIGGGEREGARDIVLVSEPSSSSSSVSSSSSKKNNNENSYTNALANFEELSSELERLALSLGLSARPALLTPSTSLASAAKIAARSKVVVGRTGPALAALVPLLPPGSGVVELVPPNWEWEGSHLLIRNLTRPLFGGAGKVKKGVLYSSWRPGELPNTPATPRSLVYSSKEDEIRFGRWSSDECAHDRECTVATARGLLSVDVAAVVDEVVLLASALLSCDNAFDFDYSAAGSASER